MDEPTALHFANTSHADKLQMIARLAVEGLLELAERPEIDTLRRLHDALEETARLRAKLAASERLLDDARQREESLRREVAEMRAELRVANANSVDRFIRKTPRTKAAS